ncbi:MAG TPA: GxxExxY protein [Candidatus Angelobacter sp.]
MAETTAGPKLRYEELIEKILGAAIEVHNTLGPGLLESAYLANIAFSRCTRILHHGVTETRRTAKNRRL